MVAAPAAALHPPLLIVIVLWRPCTFEPPASLSQLANSVEIIADSIKLTYLCRRPRPVRTSSIGGWGVCCYVMSASAGERTHALEEVPTKPLADAAC